MRLILVRHAETIENAAGIVQGHLNGTLSEKGMEQATTLAKDLEGERFDAVYSSDLLRALKTAGILMTDRKLPSVEADVRLREQNFGVHEGRSLFSMLRRVRREKADLSSFTPQGGESSAAFRGRVREFLDEIKRKHPEDTVILVTHAGTISVILDELLHEDGAAAQNIRNGMAVILML